MRVVLNGNSVPAAVDVFQPSGSADGAALRVARKRRVLHDSGVVAAGGQIDSPVLDLTGVDTLLFCCNNAGAATRNLTMTLYLDDGSTALMTGTALRVVVAGATEIVSVGPYGGTAGGPVTAVIVMTLPTKAKFSLASGGAANGRLTIIG